MAVAAGLFALSVFVDVAGKVLSFLAALALIITYFVMGGGWTGTGKDLGGGIFWTSSILLFLSYLYYYGALATADTRETNTYLILGTLIDSTSGNSPTKTFFITVFALALASAALCAVAYFFWMPLIICLAGCQLIGSVVAIVKFFVSR